jgi:SAM-dependent methyltransferase
VISGPVLSASALASISRTTLDHYEGLAQKFWMGTREHDVSQNIEALLESIRGRGPFRILDFGCGPGRDLLRFRELGHEPTGLDGAAAFVRMARERSGVEVWQQDFLALDLPGSEFHGIFANASLFHVPSQELPRVLGELWECLRPGGVLFSSNPRGQNEEGWSGDRYGVYHDFERWRAFVISAGFEAIRHYYRPEGLPREQQPWLASVWRRPDPAPCPPLAHTGPHA